MTTHHQPENPGPTAGSRRVVIHAPCDALDEAVASAMRRAPEAVEFAGFDAADARIAPAVELLKNTGHAVLVTSSQR